MQEPDIEYSCRYFRSKSLFVSRIFYTYANQYHVDYKFSADVSTLMKINAREYVAL